MSSDGESYYQIPLFSANGVRGSIGFGMLNEFASPGGHFQDQVSLPVALHQAIFNLSHYAHRYEEAASQEPSNIYYATEASAWYPVSNTIPLTIIAEILQYPGGAGLSGSEYRAYGCGFFGFVYGTPYEEPITFSKQYQFNSKRMLVQADVLFPTGIFWDLPPGMVASFRVGLWDPAGLSDTNKAGFNYNNSSLFFRPFFG